MRYKEYCICGSHIIGDGTPRESEFVRRAFWALHQGQGHGRCPQKKCYPAQYEREWQERQGVRV